MASVEAPNVPRRLATERPARAPPRPARVIRARDSSRAVSFCLVGGGVGGGDGGSGGDDSAVAAAAEFVAVVVMLD